MKTFLLLLILLLSTSLASAQATPESTNWTTEQRCITAPSQPPQGWTYDGVIFTFRPGDGVHARRADVATPYYVAFDSVGEYAWAGSFSPDGHWFAVPQGNHIGQDTLSLDNQYHIQEIRVYSTTTISEVYRVNVDWAVSLNTEIGIVPKWLDDEHILYPTGTDIGPNGPNSWITLNPFSGDITSYNGEIPASLNPSADEFGILSELVAVNHPDIPMQDYDLPLFVSYSVAESYIAFISKQGTLQIEDFATRQIIDTCIRHLYLGLAFSPDGKQLAFGLQDAGYIYILDREAWQAYRIDLAAADVIGWYPLE
jgi:WD40 repeat protein